MESENPESTVVRILKIATCPSMSGKSKLTYHVGCKAESEILFRVYANSASGFFSKEWVPLVEIQQLFGKAPDAKALTSFVLLPIFKGKSINTPAFLFAALLSERLVQPSTTTRRCYECTDGKKFFAEVKALAATGTDLTDKLHKIEAKAAANKAYREAEKQEEAAIKGQRDARGRGTEDGVKPPKAKPSASEKSAVPASKKAATKVSPKAA
ncbi:MAG: hypothetical protein Q7T44_17890 [Parvibaculum sp.]|nr:hypothetical protein [Parvibaculum sp.]